MKLCFFLRLFGVMRQVLDYQAMPTDTSVPIIGMKSTTEFIYFNLFIYLLEETVEYNYNIHT